MANCGTADSNASQFYITLTKTSWLDEQNVVFGRLSKGIPLIKNLQNYEEGIVNSEDLVWISDCGEIDEVNFKRYREWKWGISEEEIKKRKELSSKTRYFDIAANLGSKVIETI